MPEKFSTIFRGPEAVRGLSLEDYVAHIRGMDELMRYSAKCLGMPKPTTRVRPPVLTEDGGFRSDFEVLVDDEDGDS